MAGRRDKGNSDSKTSGDGRSSGNAGGGSGKHGKGDKGIDSNKADGKKR